MTISLVLDRRAFLTGAGMAAGAVAVAVRASWSIAGADLPGSAASGAVEPAHATMDWAADHVFGTYPPYAHPIPFGRQGAPPVSFEFGSFDPVLMI